MPPLQLLLSFLNLQFKLVNQQFCHALVTNNTVVTPPRPLGQGFLYPSEGPGNAHKWCLM